MKKFFNWESASGILLTVAPAIILLLFISVGQFGAMTLPGRVLQVILVAIATFCGLIVLSEGRNTRSRSGYPIAWAIGAFVCIALMFVCIYQFTPWSHG